MLVEPLNEIEYAGVFKIFMERSHEYEYMSRFLVDEINKQNRVCKILSVGAGTGYYDKQVIEQLTIKPIYVAVEPNPLHVEQLKDNLQDAQIIQDYFTTTFHTNDRYDYILFAHSLYCINNPYDIITYASNFLSKNGKIVIFHQSDIGMSEFVTKFNKYLIFDDRPFAYHHYSSQDIIKELNSRRIKCQTNRLDCYIDMNNIFEDEESLHRMLTFFIQTDTTRLPNILVNEMINEFKKNMVDNKYIHPTDAIIIYK